MEQQQQQQREEKKTRDTKMRDANSQVRETSAKLGSKTFKMAATGGMALGQGRSSASGRFRRC